MVFLIMVNITIPTNLSNITNIDTTACWQYCITPEYTFWMGLCALFLLVAYLDIDYWFRDRLNITEKHPRYVKYIFKHDFWIGMALNVMLFFYLFNLFYA